MLKKPLAVCLAVALGPMAAFAQSTPAPSGATDRPTASGSGSPVSGSPAMQPGAPAATAPSTNGAPQGQGGSASSQFVTQIQADHIMVSRLIGTRVVSTDNEAVGDINDIVMDRNGRMVAAVVGVGGFLGIGEKNVAVSFEALEFGSQQASGGNDVAATGSTATGGNASGRVVLRLSKADLQAAPSFNAEGDGSMTGSAGIEPSGSAGAPRQ